MTLRCLRLARRNPDAVLESLALPVMLMLVFAYLYGAAIHVGVRYVDFIVPGVLILCIAFGSSMTAVSVSHDLSSGIVERFKSMNVGPRSLLIGHVAASLVRNLASICLVFAVGRAIGFHPHADVWGFVAAVATLVLLALALSWFSAVVGVIVKSPEAATGFTFFSFFLVNPSSALVPVKTMPHWIRPFASEQPITAVADTVRAVLLGHSAGAAPWKAVAWCVGILAVSLAAARPTVESRMS